MTDGGVGAFQLNQNYGFAAPSLVLGDTTLKFDLKNTGADQLLTGGSAYVGGTNTIYVTGLGTSLTLGSSFNLITSNAGGLGPLHGSFVFSNGTPVENLTVGAHSYTLALENSDTSENVTVVGVDRSIDYWIGPGGNTTWNTSTPNWSSTSGGTTYKPFSNGDVAVFDNASQYRSVSVAAGVMPSAIDFNNDSNHAYTITDSGSNVIGGAGTATLVGTGSVTLVGQNTFTGLTKIDAGTLKLGSSAGLGSVGGPIADNAALVFGNTTAQTFSGAISGTGTVSTSSGAAALTLSGASTYSGLTTIGSSTTLKAGAANALSANSSYSIAGTLDLNGNDEAIGSLSGAGTVSNSTAATTRTLTVGADGTSTTFTGLLQDGGSTAKLALAVGAAGAGAGPQGSPGGLTLTHVNTFTGGTTISDGTLALGADGANNENGNSLGTGPVTISGGQLRLGGASGSVVSYSIPNAVTLDGGEIFANDGAQRLTGLLTVAASGGSLVTQRGGKDLFLDGGVTGSGSLSIDNQQHTGGTDIGTVHFSSNGTDDFSGTLTVNAPDSAIGLDGGVIQIDNNLALQDGTVEMDGGHGIVFANGVTAPKFGNLSGRGNINLATTNNSAVNLTVGNDDFSTLYSGVLSGSGGLTKAGSNTLTLTGVSTFTGGTTIGGGSLRLSDNNHQILNPPPLGSTGYIPADISGNFNLTGITHNGVGFTGGLDGNGLAIVDTLLGSTVNWNSANFNFGQSEVNDVVQAAGQDLNVTSGRYSELDVLATAVGGNQSPQTFKVNYTDGSCATFNQGVSDWTKATNASLYSGETRVRTMDHANTSAGSQVAGSYTVYGYKFVVDSTKTVSSITLPNDNHIVVLAATGVALTDTATNLTATPAGAGTIHLSWTAPIQLPGYPFGYNIYRGQSAGGESASPLNSSTYIARDATTFDDSTVVPGNTYYYTIQAIYAYYYYPNYYPVPGPLSNEALAAAPTSGPIAQIDLASSFNLTGITSGGTFSSAGGLDGNGHALSATALGTPNWHGVDFRIDLTGSSNVVKATGQTITLPQGEYTQLEMLATAVNGNQTSKTFTVNYDDGTSDTFTRSISDWTMPQNYTAESIALATTKANTYSGGQTATGTYDVYGYEFALASTKNAISITLPNDNHIIVLGITSKTANLLPIGSAVTIAARAALDLNGTNQEFSSISGTGGDVLLANSTLKVGNSNASTNFGGTFDGSGALTKVGTGTLTLSGVNTYSGVTTVSGGTLTAGATDAFSPYSSYTNWPADNNWTTELNANGFPQVTPAQPTDFFGTRATASEIDLSWNDPVAGLYQVEQQTANPNTWNILGTTTASNYAVTGLATGGQCAFRVIAISPFGNSSYSATANCATLTSSGPDDTPLIVRTPLTPANRPVTTTHTTLNVAVYGAGPVSCTWSATSVPDGAAQPSFTGSGVTYFNGPFFSLSEPYTTVTFSQAGDYTLQAVITDANGVGTISSAAVTVQQTLNSLSVAPTSAAVKTGESRRFDAIGKDQFGNPMQSQPNITWSVTSGPGSIASGLYSAPSSGGDFTSSITASASGLSATANVAVIGNDSSGVYVQAIDKNEVKVYDHNGTLKEELPVDGPFPQGLTFHGPDSISLADGSHLEASPTNPYSLVRKNTGGTVIQTYIASLSSDEAPWSGMVLDPNGTSFWACDYSCYVYEFDINSGAQDQRFKASDVLGKIGILGSGAAPTLDLLDDANNNGGIDPTPGTGSDEALKNTDPGKVILVSDAAADQNGDADPAHVAEMDISVTANTSSGQTPADLTGWTLKLAPAEPDSSTQIYGGADKSQPQGSSETWTLSGDYSSGPFTAKVYVAESEKGKVLMQLALADQSGHPKDSATAGVTEDKATLIAKKVNGADSQTGLPNYGGALKHGDTAYVPVDNEDQYYVENGHTLVSNKDQTSTVTHDWALLPFTVHLPKGIAGTYQLKFPDSIRVFIGPNTDSENKVISEGTSIGTLLDSHGDAKLYIEGVTRDGAVKIDLKKQGVAAALDTLKVNVFELDGPQNVPNYSKYTYVAKWGGAAPVTGEARWEVEDGQVGKIVKTTGADRADIQWGRGPTVGAPIFAASPDYDWAYHVNIVRLETATPTRQEAPTLNGKAFYSDQKPAQGLHAGHLIDPIPNPDENAADIQGVFIRSNENESRPAMAWGATVRASGPIGHDHVQMGVDQIVVGFSQIITSVDYVATYKNTNPSGQHVTLRFSLDANANGPLRDAQRGLSEQSGWYAEEADKVSNLPSYAQFVGINGTTLSQRTIASEDVPTIGVPLSSDQTLVGQQGDPNKILTSATLRMTFRDYVGVGVFDPAQESTNLPIQNVYTIIATAGADWDWNGSGSLNATNMHWTFTNGTAGDHEPQNNVWQETNAKQALSGGASIDPKSRTTVIELPKARWK